MKREPKNKRGGRGEGDGKEVSFLSFPPPPRSFSPFTRAIFRAVFDSRSSFLLRNLTAGSTPYQTLRNGQYLTLRTAISTEQWRPWTAVRAHQHDIAFGPLGDQSCVQGPMMMNRNEGETVLPFMAASHFPISMAGCIHTQTTGPHLCLNLN